MKCLKEIALPFITSPTATNHYRHRNKLLKFDRLILRLSSIFLFLSLLFTNNNVIESMNTSTTKTTTTSTITFNRSNVTIKNPNVGSITTATREITILPSLSSNTKHYQSLTLSSNNNNNSYPPNIDHMLLSELELDQTTMKDINENTTISFLSNNTQDNCFIFEKVVGKYSEEQNCQFNIDLDGRTKNFSDNIWEIMKRYHHCHIVSGYISLRHFIFKPFNNISQNLVFSNLEYIRDFLLVHDFQSRFDVNITLGQIFPRLRRIYGYSRIEHLTLYISNFYSSDRIGLFALKEICGSVKIFLSRPYFRHSPTYWHVVKKYRGQKYFSKNLTRFKSDNVMIEGSLNSSSSTFDARLRFDGIISEFDRRRASVLHVSIYEIDPTFYNYVETNSTDLGDKPSKFCNVSSRMVVLSDLDYSDKQFLYPYETDVYDEGKFPSRLIYDVFNQSKSNNYQEHPEHFAYHRRLDNFDICRIKNFAIELGIPIAATSDINKSHSDLMMNETYRFVLDHVYVIKLELCNSRRHEKCHVLKRYLFIPLQQDFKKYEKISWNHLGSFFWTCFLVGSMILIIVMSICLSIGKLKSYRFRLKSFVNMDVVSVNPDYGLIINQSNHIAHSIDHESLWSWPSSSIAANYGIQSSSIDNVTCEINRQNLTIFTQKLLGKGEFGYVYEGSLLLDHDLNCTYHGGCGSQVTMPNCNCNFNLNNNFNNTQTTTTIISTNQLNSIRVAIKQLKENSNCINKEKFIMEAKYMKTFNSNFLVKLIGVSTVEEPILVIMEYMENGDLKRFLRQRYNDYLKSRNGQLLPSFEQITRIAIQIADGMHYLHSKKIIHRDLAARNCMVSSDLTVKIGDFGLTRDLYEKDYYRLSEEAPMPLRWMAPESVRKMIFTPHSDVWSYGVVLWEIMSFGEQPYRGRPDVEVKKLISNNVRLSRPFYYFEPLWNIAKQCWRKKPGQRPDFAEIIEMLYPHLTLNRQQFDNLSYYVSSRMGSYVKFSTFGLLLNHCYQFLWKSCPLSSSSNSNQRRKSSSFFMSSFSSSSTATTRPLFHQRRRDTNSSIATQQEQSSICACPFRFYSRKQQREHQLSFNRFHRQCSQSSSSTITTTATDQMIMMNMMIGTGAGTNGTHCSSSHHNGRKGNAKRNYSFSSSSYHSSFHSHFHPNLTNRRCQMYSSLESLPGSSSTDVQSEITAITSLSMNHQNYNVHQQEFQDHNQIKEGNSNYEVMSGSASFINNNHNNTILKDSSVIPLI